MLRAVNRLSPQMQISQAGNPCHVKGGKSILVAVQPLQSGTALHIKFGQLIAAAVQHLPKRLSPAFGPGKSYYSRSSSAFPKQFKPMHIKGDQLIAGALQLLQYRVTPVKR